MSRIYAWLSLMPVCMMAQGANSAEFDFHQHNQDTMTKSSWEQTQDGIRIMVKGSDDLFLGEQGLGVEDGAANELDAKNGNNDQIEFRFFDNTNQPLNVVIKSLRLKMFEPKVSQDKATLVQLDGRELASLNSSLSYTTSAGFGKDRHIGQSWALEDDVEVVQGFTIKPDKNAGFYIHSIEVEAMDMPPVFASTPTLLAEEGVKYEYRLDVRDEHPNEVTLALIEGPQGMVISPQTTTLVWEPNFESQGQFPVKVTATDNQGQVSEHKFLLEVNNRNQAPLFTTTPVIQAKETQPYQYKIATLDKDQDAVFVKILEAPLGMKYDEKTQLLTWTPNYDQAGDHFIKLGASDVFDETQQSFSIKVEDTNRLPKITSKPDDESKEGGLYQYQLSATDPDRDTLTYKLLHGPEALSLDAVSGKMQWQPDFLQAGVHKIKVQVDDGKQGIAEQAFEIEVENVNRAPKFTSQPVLNVAEKQFYRYRLTATDEDLTGVTFALEDGPSGMQYNEAVNSLQWTPEFDDAGEHTVVVSVYDGEARVEQSFKLNVENINRAPVWTAITDQALNEGEKLAMQVEASDLDDDAVHYELLQAPANLALNPKNGHITWTPEFNQAGDHQVWLNAVDALGGQTEISFNLRVANVNQAPEILTKAIVQGKETQPYFYAMNAKDFDQDVLSYKLIKGPKGMQVDAAQGYVSWQPGFADAGEHAVEVEVSDGFTQAKQAFVIKVENQNRLPEWVSVPVTQGAETREYRYPLKVSDADSDNVFFELLAGPKGMTLDEKSATLLWTPDYEQAGVHNVEVRVTDGHSGIADQSFAISVNNQNRAPKWISQAPTRVKENRLYRYQLQATDEDGDRLKYKLISATKGIQLDPYSHTLTWRPDFRSAGEHDIKLSVTDGQSVVEQRISLTVLDENRAPKINSVAPMRAQEGSLYEYAVAASDLDTDVLTYKLLQAPKAMEIDPSTGMIQWQIGFEDAGQQGIEVEVTDGKGGVVTQTFGIAVANVNRVPEIISKPVTELDLGKPFRYRIQGEDADWNALSYRLIKAPQGMTLDAATQTLSWSGVTMSAGEHQVVVEVSDGEAKQEQAFSLQLISPTAIAVSE